MQSCQEPQAFRDYAETTCRPGGRDCGIGTGCCLLPGSAVRAVHAFVRMCGAHGGCQLLSYWHRPMGTRDILTADAAFCACAGLLNRAREALRQCLPDLLRNPGFTGCLKSDDTTRRWLAQLLVNVGFTDSAAQLSADVLTPTPLQGQ